MRVCIECGEVGTGTRCEQCQAVRAWRANQMRGGATARGYTRAWEKRAAKVKRAQPYCSVCGATEDLTVDHIVPKARGGSDEPDNLRTLCRRHNSAKGGRG